MLPVLLRKALREVWTMRGQALAIVILVAAGMASFLASMSTYQSLKEARDRYYRSERFADVFVSLKRCPQHVASDLAAIPGVASLTTRIQYSAQLDLPGLDEPATALISSVETSGDAQGQGLNALHMVSGRWPDHGADTEVLLSQQFSEGTGLRAGDSFHALINGRQRRLTVVGTALSPEFIYVLRPGSLIPDNARYGVIWMQRDALASLAGMTGAFNSVALRLGRNANSVEVIARLDHQLERYGSAGAYDRSQHQSHQFLQSEFDQLQAMGTVVPIMFLLVAVFLLNVILTRLIRTQREIIGTLRAFGYTRWAVGLHYLAMAAVLVIPGCLLGALAGTWMGRGLVELYQEYYAIPALTHRLNPSLVSAATLAALIAASLGTLRSAWGAATLSPAIAMRAEAPATFRRSVLEVLGLQRLVPQMSRMVLRNLERHPIKALLSVAGIACAMGLLVVGNFWQDAINHWLFSAFNYGMREDVVVTFNERIDQRAEYELARLPGVEHVQSFAFASATLANGHRTRNVAIQGLKSSDQLHRVIERSLNIVSYPPTGMVVTDLVAERLGVRPGDRLELRFREGERRRVEVCVVGLVDELSGMNAYMDRDALHELLREERTLSGAYLRVEKARLRELYHELKAAPAVAGVSLTQQSRVEMERMMSENIGVFSAIQVLLAAIIAFGVVYNVGRISLAERQRELASMRVLGFTRAEVSRVLLEEMALLTLLALPLGAWFGWLLAHGSAAMNDPEIVRLPVVISERSYALACVTVIGASLVTALIVRRRVDRLDLVAVLKIRE